MNAARNLRWIEVNREMLISTHAGLIEDYDDELALVEDALVIEMFEAHAALVGGRVC